MTRKDYNLIANILQEAFITTKFTPLQRATLLTCFDLNLKVDNHNFSPSRFDSYVEKKSIEFA